MVASARVSLFDERFRSPWRLLAMLRGGVVGPLLMLGACGSQNASSQPAPSAGAGGASGGSVAAGGSAAGTAGASGSTSGGAGSSAGGSGGTSVVAHYPDAPTAPTLAPWTAPTVETNLAAETGDDWHARDSAALQAFVPMFVPANGTWTAGYRWTFANDVEAVESSYARTGGENYWNIVVNSFDKGKYDNFEGEPGYDDELWWAHTWLRAYEARGEVEYLEMAKAIFADATKGWEPKNCSGGVWWQKRAVYKNAITNELFLLVAAALHNHVPNDSGPGSYLDWAQKEWQWFSKSGIINASNLINDGLSDTCANNGQTTWTYNQGVILGALVEMYQATGDASFITRAEALADASTKALVDENGIFRETCGGACDGDQVSFKGIYLRNLARLYDWDHRASYYDFMVKNARSVWNSDRDAANHFGSNWAGPFDLADSSRQSSAMFALSALADPYSQASPFLLPSGAPNVRHALGQRSGLAGWACDSASCASAGLMLESTNVSSVAPGRHTLHVYAAVATAGGPSGALVTVDVLDATTQLALASLDVAATDFPEVGVLRGFALPYTQNAADHPVRYRVRWNAVAGAPRVTLSDVSVDGADSLSAANLAHECGRFDAHSAWTVDRFRDSTACALARGGALALDDGDFVAETEIRVDEFALDGATLATLSVIDREENKLIASLDVKRTDFSNTSFRSFAVPFHAYRGDHYDVMTAWRAAPSAPRLTERGVYVRRAMKEQPLTLPFNQRGMGTMPSDGALDGSGSALAQASFGAARSFFGHAFRFGVAGNDVLQGSPDKVPVPAGNYASLELIALAVNGTQPDLGFVLSYADGSTQTVVQSVSDWLSAAPQANERIALAMPYRWSKTAKEYGNFHAFHYSLPVDAKKALASLTLPNNQNVKVLAATLVGAP